MSCFVDTNLLVYALDPAAPAKREAAAAVIRTTIRRGLLVLSPQSLNECYVVITRKRMMPIGEARAYVRAFVPYVSAPLDGTTVELSWRVQDETGFSPFDCVLLASALQAGCRTFLSEDMRERTVGPLTILNPLTLPPDRLAAQL